MMHMCMFIYSALLFFVLSPGVLLSLPAGGSCCVKAAVHAVVFALVYQLTHKSVMQFCLRQGMY